MNQLNSRIFKLFVRFLKENKCYYNFYKYTKNKEINKYIPSEWIISTFSWVDSIEGFCFWEKIHHKWLRLLGDFYINNDNVDINDIDNLYSTLLFIINNEGLTKCDTIEEIEHTKYILEILKKNKI